MVCPICGREAFVKNGARNGLQCFKCKHCGFQRTKERSRYSEADRRAAAALRASGLSYRAIAERLGIGRQTAYRFVNPTARGGAGGRGPEGRAH
jgi:transposase-like protein